MEPIMTKMTFIAAVLVAGSSFQTMASNLKWLEYSPTSYFTEKDWDMAKATAKPLLDNGKAGESASWNNEKTRNGGKFTLVKTREHNGQTCNVLRIENHAKTMQGSAEYEFCKQSDGTWKSPQAKL